MPPAHSAVWRRILQDLANNFSLSAAETEGNPQADDFEMTDMFDQIPAVVSDALLGKNVPHLYPRFYRALLQEPKLLSDFLEMLEDLAESQGSPVVKQLPERGFDFSFLWQPGEKGSIASWGYTAAQLQNIFSTSPNPAEPAYRRTPKGLSGDHFVLLQEMMLLGDQEVQVRLDGYLVLDAGEQLFPFLRILDGQQKLFAQLTWGSYVDGGEIEPDGSYEFKPLLFNQIIDENGAVRAPLFLSLTHSV